MKPSYEVLKNVSSPEEKKEYWDVATGLQQVDDLNPSEYLYSLAQRNIDGELTNEEIEELLYQKYEEIDHISDHKQQRKKECDIVSNRIVIILQEDAFTFSPAMLKFIHKKLFDGFEEVCPGEYRKVNISKKEPILGNNSVKYANYQMIEDIYAYDFEQEKKKNYSSMVKDEVIKQISGFTSAIWQVHPFMEGNTRTTAVFIECYLNHLGFCVNNEPFARNAKYFRNALVRSNYADYSKGIDTEQCYLEMFYENLLFNGKKELRNRDLIVPSLVKDIRKISKR